MYNIFKYQQNNSSSSLFKILIEICGRRRKGCWGETTESRYQPTNGPDSPALYVSITTNTMCTSFFKFEKIICIYFFPAGHARKWYPRWANRGDSGALYVSITKLNGSSIGRWDTTVPVSPLGPPLSFVRLAPSLVKPVDQLLCHNHLHYHQWWFTIIPASSLNHHHSRAKKGSRWQGWMVSTCKHSLLPICQESQQSLHSFKYSISKCFQIYWFWKTFTMPRPPLISLTVPVHYFEKIKKWNSIFPLISSYFRS